MEKTTDELINDIKETKSINAFIESNAEEFDSLLFVKTLQSHLDRKNISRQQLTRATGLNQSYVYDILRASKNPSRDTVVKLAFALGLNLDETNRLLKLAGFNELYPRIERDAILIFCIENQKSMNCANDLLYDMKEVGSLSVYSAIR